MLNLSFKARPTDHSTKSVSDRARHVQLRLKVYRPIWLRVEGSYHQREKDYKSILLKQSCKARYNYVFDTLEDFINKYDNEPKQTLSWMSTSTHDSVNGAFEQMSKNTTFNPNRPLSD